MGKPAMDLEPAIACLREDHRLLALYLIGSAKEGRMRPDSDVDIAILLEPGTAIGDVERLDLAARATFALGREVDLGVISSSNLVYAREAILCGDLLYAREAGRADLATTGFLGLYARFNEDRREVVDAYRT